jgi:hypothetical protein
MPIHSRLLLSRWWGAPNVGGERQRGFFSFTPDRPPTPLIKKWAADESM